MKKLLQGSVVALFLTSVIAIAAEVTDLNTTDAQNTNSTFGLEDSTAPSQVADRYQAYQGAVARYIADMSSGLTVDTQSTNTTYKVTANNTTTTLIDGWMLALQITETNGVSPTLNVNGTGAKALEHEPGSTLSAGAIETNQRILVSYNDTTGTWQVIAGAKRPAGTSYSDPLTTRGDIVTRGASATQRLAKGVCGYVLRSNGLDSVWATVVSTGLDVGAVTKTHLAPGTVGNLITWNESRVAQEVTAGEAGSILTSNGVGQYPTYQAAAAGGCTFVSKSSPSNVASVSLTGLTEYPNYMFILNLVPVDDGVSGHFKISVNNGGAYLGANYNDAAIGRTSAGATDTFDHAAASVMQWTESVGTDTGEGTRVTMWMLARTTVAIDQHFRFAGSTSNNAGAVYSFVGGAHWDRSAASNTSDDVDAVQFLFSSGNVESGTVIVYGCPDS